MARSLSPRRQPYEGEKPWDGLPQRVGRPEPSVSDVSSGSELDGEKLEKFNLLFSDSDETDNESDVSHCSPSLAIEDNPDRRNWGKRKREREGEEEEGGGGGGGEGSTAADEEVIVISSDEEDDVDVDEALECWGVRPLLHEEKPESDSDTDTDTDNTESEESEELEYSESGESDELLNAEDSGSSFDFDAFFQGKKQPDGRGTRDGQRSDVIVAEERDQQEDGDREREEKIKLLFAGVSSDEEDTPVGQQIEEWERMDQAATAEKGVHMEVSEGRSVEDDIVSISSEHLGDTDTLLREALECWGFKPMEQEEDSDSEDTATDSASEESSSETEEERERERERERGKVKMRSMGQILGEYEEYPTSCGSDDLEFSRTTVRSALAPVVDKMEQTAWVAYLKESESKQIVQEGQYQPLPHIMYRPTYFKPESPHKSRTRKCIQSQLFPTLACAFCYGQEKLSEKLSETLSESRSYKRMQDLFRGYILKANERSDIWEKILEAKEEDISFEAIKYRASSVAQLYKLIAEHANIILHYEYDSETLLVPSESRRRSNVQIAIICRKSTVGTKEINKIARCISQKMQVSSLGLRIDLLISSELRKTLSKEEMSSLAAVAREFEKKVSDEIQGWNVELLYKYLLSLEEEKRTDDDTEEGDREASNRNDDVKSMTLKCLIDRVSCLSRKEKTENIESIMSKIREDPETIGFVTRRSLSDAFLYACSSIIALVLVDRSIHTSTSKQNFPSFGKFHFLCRVNSRDSFEYEMIQKKVKKEGKVGGDVFSYMKTEFYFPRDSVPDNYKKEVRASYYNDKEGLYPAGVTTYTDFFKANQMTQIENKVKDLNEEIRNNHLPDTCFQHTKKTNVGVTRTKTFFGARYLWTKDQMKEMKDSGKSDEAAGIRVDVPPVPQWIIRMIQRPLEESGLLKKDFMNSAAINYYHDGSEGIQSHYDDEKRFARPVFSLRMFSDSRLSFGTKTQAYLNGAFFVPMPRGCITVMEEAGYAANGIKHSVRPYDMTGKSVSLMLRHVRKDRLQKARELYPDEQLHANLQCSESLQTNAKDVPADDVMHPDQSNKENHAESSTASLTDNFLENCLSGLKALELSKS